MGFLSGIFGKKSVLTEEELNTKAEELLGKIEQEAGINCKAAMKSIEKRGEELEPLLDFGGKYHQRFCETVLQTISGARQEKKILAAEIKYNRLPSVKVLPSNEFADFAGLLDAVKNTDADVIYIRDMEMWNDYGGTDVVADMEMLYILAVDPMIQFIFHAPCRYMLRKNFLIAETADIKKDAKIKEALEDIFMLIEEGHGSERVKQMDGVYSFGFDLYK
ncbi:MAG: hypothetical protein M1269_09410 [Chloroflexi bacterium]|nr:hypothetical protein [Chloroflexota bacterium]